MKKMLKKLFLFLILIASMSYSITGGENTELEKYIKIEAERIEKNERILSIISADLEEEFADLAYQGLDSIPINSPITTTDLKRISSDYGYRIHPIFNVRNFHKGIDFVAPSGCNILSTAHGTVRSIKKSSHGYGNQIIIQHGHGFETRYAHLSNITVIVGQQVNTGDIIGTLGSSGLTTGPHLHYEIINNNKPIDPMFFSYIDKNDRNNKDYISTLRKLETT